MESRIQFLITTLLSGILLVLVIANIWLSLGNIDRQREVNNRQALIQQGQQFSALYQNTAKTLADLAVGKSDDQLKQMLANQGLTINTQQADGNPQGGQANDQSNGAQQAPAKSK